jgi:uncharacterized membrane protein required for colicin V production
MSALDTILIIIIVAGGFYGFRRGISGQLGSLAGTIFGVILCHAFSDDLAAWFNSPQDNFQTRLLHTVLSYAVIFFATVLAGRLLSATIAKLLDALHLSLLNRVTGAAFTILLYTILLSLLLNIWITIFPDSELKSTNDSVAQTTLNIGPKVLGSETVREVYDGMHNIADRINNKQHNSEPSTTSER